MFTPDLSGVDPLRRAETTRRIDVIRTYLDTANPTQQDRVDSGQLLGMGPAQFGNLVRAWQKHQSPEALAGAGAQRGKPRRRPGGAGQTACKRFAQGRGGGGVRAMP